MNGRVELAKAWFAKGASDLTAARAILTGAGPYDTACFHCQQAVEKFMKGFLSHRGREFPFTHDLDELAKLCDEIEPSLNLSTPEVISLSPITPFACVMTMTSGLRRMMRESRWRSPRGFSKRSLAWSVRFEDCAGPRQVACDLMRANLRIIVSRWHTGGGAGEFVTTRW